MPSISSENTSILNFALSSKFGIILNTSLVYIDSYYISGFLDELYAKTQSLFKEKDSTHLENGIPINIIIDRYFLCLVLY